MRLTKIGPSAVPSTEVVGRSTRVTPLSRRYSASDLAILSEDERARFLDGGPPDPQRNPTLAWELLYRLEPDRYDRLVRAERLHPGILDWLPAHVDRIVEVGPGSGRLTLPLVSRCNHLTAVEPAAPLRELLARRLRANTTTIHLINGFLDALPLADRAAELVTACSVLTPEPAHGGDRGLAEMERICAPGGMVVIVWPNHPQWLVERRYQYLSFPGEMAMEFATVEEAIELAEIFYPESVSEIKARGERRVPYEILGVNPPRDLAYRVIS
jgi:SAM-dependent methyltransferase